VLHVFANVVIVALTAKSGLRAFLNPSSSTLPLPNEAPQSHYYLVWIFTLHAYHPIFFRTGAMDWIHHLPVYFCNILMFGCLSGDIFCAQSIILTGIPGGLDYLLLVMEGEGKLSRTRYKHLSAIINNWFRAPLGFISGYACLVGLVQQYESCQPTQYQSFVFTLMGIHGMWNPPFFGRQAIEANIIDTINRFELVGRASKSADGKLKPIALEEVRAKSGKEPPPSKKAE
jgi:hypothetical protein